ncbi:MAG: MobA/MobL family protein [Oscillospiraceae bacterium]
MANYHLEVKNISRGAGHSLARLLNYICGREVADNYLGRKFSRKRNDVLFTKVFLPANAPPDYCDLQHLCDEIEKSEKRYDARTGREFICSLPNELPYDELEKIVSEFIEECFTSRGVCAVAATHEGRNETDPSRNNPHVHIIISTRTADKDGFSKKKAREFDKRECVGIWRKKWELVLNRAYERSKRPERVSCESYEIQRNTDIEPTIHLSRIDWQKEKRGERTPNGDIKREISKRNQEKRQEKERKRKKMRGRSISR